MGSSDRKGLEVRGVYDASQGVEIARLFSDAGNTDLRPIKNWQAFAEKNGLKGAIDLVDLKPIADALKEAYTAMEQIKNQVYEITGISDIIRGKTEATETATAQQIKGQYASLRLRSMQQDVAVFATELLKLKAQIVSGFDAQTLAQISAVDQLAEADKPIVPQALQLIADKPLRNFRVEIAADSMVQIDEREEKESRVEFLTAVGAFVKGAAEIGASAPVLAPLLMELLQFGVRGFKVGKTIEGTMDQALEQLKQQAAQPQQQRPDPEMAKVEIERQKAQVEAERGQQQMALEREKASNDMNLQREKQAFDQQMQREQMEREMMLKDTMHQREMSQREMEASNNTVNDVKMAFGEHQNKVGQMVTQAKHERELGVVTQKQEEKAQSQAQSQDAVANVQREMQELAKSVQSLIEQLGRPKRIVRGPDGRASGVETVQ